MQSKEEVVEWSWWWWNSNMANIFWCWLGIVTSKDLLSKRFWLQLSQILVEPWHHRAAWKQNVFLENWNCFKLCWRRPLNIVLFNISSCIPGFCPSKQTTCKGIKQTVEIKVMSVFPWFRMGFVLTLICPKHSVVTNSFQSVKWRHFYVWIPRF